MDVIRYLRERAKKDIKRIAFPESQDLRIRKARDYLEHEKIVYPFLVTPEIMEDDRVERLANFIYEKKKIRGMTIEEARKIAQDPLYYSLALLKEKVVDGVVSGAVYTTASVARAVITCLDKDEGIDLVTSCFIMVVPDCPYGEEGVFVFADCGIIPQPSPEQLAKIAILSGRFMQKVLEKKPYIAFLSFSTKGSAENRSTMRVREAVEIAKSMCQEFPIDGELQLDSAIVPEVAKIKLGDSPVAGRANVLIFPNLEAGNISYKLTERLGKARALGPIILGTKQPASDLSRGCSWEDIVDVSAVIAIRAQGNE